MPDRPDVILLTGAQPLQGWQAAADAMAVPRGRVVVAVCEPKRTRGAIELPDEVAGAERPDAGTVLASGISELEPGDFVAVRPYDGTSRREVTIGGVSFDEVRFYGVYADLETTETYDVRESVVAKMTEGFEIQPLGRMIVLETLGTPETSAGGVFLPVDVQCRPNEAVVRSKGAKVTEVSVGERVIYHPFGLLAFDIPGNDRLRLCPVDAIEAVLL